MRIGRKPEEDWIEYINRATYRCEKLAADMGSKEWLMVQRERKWRFAEKRRVELTADGAQDC